MAIARHHGNSSRSSIIGGGGGGGGGKTADVDVDDSRAVKVTPDDVIVAGGASGALELVLTALLDEDTVLLGELARPGGQGYSPNVSVSAR